MANALDMEDVPSYIVVSTLKIPDFPFLLLQICSITRHTLQHVLLCELDLAIITAWKWDISDIKPFLHPSFTTWPSPPLDSTFKTLKRCESVRGASAGRPGLAKRTGPLKPMAGSYQRNRVLGGSPHLGYVVSWGGYKPFITRPTLLRGLINHSY